MITLDKLNEYVVSQAKNNIHVKEMYFDENEWNEILMIWDLKPPEKPMPPVKKRAGGVGFFSYWNEIEYDFHAPEYLEELKKWEIRYKEWLENSKKDIKELNFNSAFGIIKLKRR